MWYGQSERRDLVRGMGRYGALWAVVVLALDLLGIPQPGSASSLGSWTSDGSSVAVAVGDQAYSNLASDESGGAIAVWEDGRNGTKSIYAQRLSSTGEPLWHFEGVRLCAVPSDQWRPQVVSDGEGGGIVTWFDYRNGNADVFAQRIDASGNILWDSQGVAVATGTQGQWAPQISEDGEGGAVIAWEELAITTLDLYAQRVDGNGALLWTNPVAVSNASANQESPRIALVSVGAVVIVWQDWRSGTQDVYAQRLSPTGNASWNLNGKAVALGAGNQTAANLATDGSGGTVIAWQSDSGGNWDLFAQRLNDQGAEQWTTGGVAVCTASGSQTELGLVNDGAGGAIMTWRDERGSSADIYCQRVNSMGTTLWASNGVTVCNATGNQVGPVIRSNGLGGAVLAWQDLRGTDEDVYAQIIDQDGASLRSANGFVVSDAPTAQQSLSIVPNDLGGAIICWTDNRNSSKDIYALRIGPVKIQGHVSVDYFYSPNQDHVSIGLDRALVQAIETSTNAISDQVITEDLDGTYELTVNEGWTGNVQVSSTPYPIWNHVTPTALAISQIHSEKTQDFILSHQVNSSWISSGLSITQAGGPVTSQTMVPDGTGGVIVAWLDTRNGNSDVFAQKLYKDGDTFWSSSGTPVCTAPGEQTSLQVAPNGYEGSIACWLDRRSGSRWDIYAQAINGWGDVVWTQNGQLVAQDVSNASPPVIATDAAGAPSIVYQRGTDLFTQVQSLQYEIALCTASGEQTLPSITSNPSGHIALGAIVAWMDMRNGSDWDIYAQRLDYWTNSVAGAPWPQNGKAVCTATGAQAVPVAIADDADGAFVTWIDFRSGSGEEYADIYAQRIGKDGPLWWSANGVVVCSASASQTAQQEISDGQGGMVVVWEDKRGGTSDIYAQRINGYGVAQWTTNGVVVSNATGNQKSPRIAHDGSGNFVVTWTDDRSGTDHIYAQKIDANGSALGQANGFTLNSWTPSQTYPIVVGDIVSDSGSYITWIDQRSGSGKLYADHVKPTRSISGQVTDVAGAGVQGITIEAIQRSNLISLVPSASATTDLAGNYTLRVDDGWEGIVRPQTTEWFATFSPAEIGYVITGDITGQNFTAVHTGEEWINDWATGIPICTNEQTQSGLVAVEDGLGGAIAAWVDFRNEPTPPNQNPEGDVYIQRIDGMGNVLWTVNGGVVVVEGERQSAPTIAGDGAGGGIVVWEDNRAGNTDLYVQQIFAGGGVRWPGGRILCDAVGEQSRPAIVKTQDGSYVIVWEDSRGGHSSEIYAGKLLANGDLSWPIGGQQITPEYYVRHRFFDEEGNPYFEDVYYNKYAPALVQHGAGGALLVWRTVTDEGNKEMRGLAVADNGSIETGWPTGSPAGQGVTIISGVSDPKIAPDGAGGGFVAAQLSGPMKVRRIDGAGGLSLEFSTTSSAKSNSVFDIVSDGANGALIAFVSSGSDPNILVQKFNGSGPVWTQDKVVCANTSEQKFPQICAASGSMFFVSWEDKRSSNQGIYAQQVDANNQTPNVLWQQDGVALAHSSMAEAPELVRLNADKGCVLFTDAWNIYAQFVQNLNVHARVSTNVQPAAFLFTCPRASQDAAGSTDPLQVTVDIQDETRFTFTGNPTLDFVYPSSGPVRFYSEGTLNPTWNTVGSVLRAVVNRMNISGAGTYNLPVRINGSEVGSAFVSVRSPDINGDGTVNGVDLAMFSMGYSSPPKPYDSRFDYNGDGQVSGSDFSRFVSHYNHTNTGGPASPSLEAPQGGPLSLQLWQSPGEMGVVHLRMWLAEVNPLSSMIGAITFDKAALEFIDWKQADDKGTRMFTPDEQEGRSVLLIGAVNVAPTDGKGVDLGEVTFRLKDGHTLSEVGSFELALGEASRESGSVVRISGIRIEGGLGPSMKNLLAQNYPNPFNMATTIEYSLAEDAHVNLSIYNVSGQLVRTLVNEDLPASAYGIQWDGRDNQGTRVSPGAYFYRVKTKQFTNTKKMVLWK